MLRRSISLTSITGLLLSLWGASLLTREARGQGRRGDEGIELPQDIGAGELGAKYKKAKNDFNKLVGGQTPFDKKDAAMIDVAAQWLTLRVTWRDIQKSPDAKKLPTAKLREVHAEFHSVVRDAITYKEKNQPFMAAFTPLLVKHLKEALENGNRMARVNAALLASELSKTGRPELIDFLVQILQGKDEAVKIHALRGLKELFQAQPPAPQNPAAQKARDGQYARVLAELLKYFDPKLNIPPKATDADKEFYYSVPRYFRREAVRALAQIRQPALTVDKAGKVEGPIAYHLMRILAGKDVNLSPPPSLSEQLEAALGLCQLRPGANDPYQADLAVYLVARFIASDLVEQFNKDWERTDNPNIKSKEKAVRAELWKTYAARLAFALEEWPSATQDPKTKKNIGDLRDLIGKPILNNMESIRPKRIDDVKRLSAFVDKIKPADAAVYKGNADYEIKVAAE